MTDSINKEIRKCKDIIAHLEKILKIADEDEIEDFEQEINELRIEIMLLEQKVEE